MESPFRSTAHTGSAGRFVAPRQNQKLHGGLENPTHSRGERTVRVSRPRLAKSRMGEGCPNEEIPHCLDGPSLSGHRKWVGVGPKVKTGCEFTMRGG